MPIVYLTAQQLARMQRKLQIGTNEDVFTDEELDDIYLEAGLNFNVAMATAIEELLFDAAKLHNYKAGQTSENKKEIFDNLLALQKIYSAKGQSSNQVLIVGLRGVPPRKIARPTNTSIVGTNKDLSAGAVQPFESDFGIKLGSENDIINE